MGRLADLGLDLMSWAGVLSLMWEMLAIGYEQDVSCRIRLGTNLGSKLWDGGPSPERDLQRSGRAVSGYIR